jgi:hypothetical protein
MSSVWITFTNPDGVVVVREVTPVSIRFDRTKRYNTHDHWILSVIDPRDGKRYGVPLEKIQRWSSQRTACGPVEEQGDLP